jgi:hypothetical protein
VTSSSPTGSPVAGLQIVLFAMPSLLEFLDTLLKSHQAQAVRWYCYG